MLFLAIPSSASYYSVVNSDGILCQKASAFTIALLQVFSQLLARKMMWIRNTAIAMLPLLAIAVPYSQQESGKGLTRELADNELTPELFDARRAGDDSNCGSSINGGIEIVIGQPQYPPKTSADVRGEYVSYPAR